MIGRAIVLYLTFALALSAVAVADQTTDELVDEGLKSLFGRAVAEEVLQIDDLFSFDVANEYLCVLRKPDGDESSIFEVYNIFTREKLWSVQRPARNFRINRGPRPSVVLYHYIPYERINLWVYDLSGEHLFDMPEAEWGLVGSPSGEYFCQNDWDLGSATVWDRYGNELFIKDVQGPDFSPVPFNDSIVIFSSCQEANLVHVPSGAVLDSVPPEEGFSSIPPKIIAALNSSQALLSWQARDFTRTVHYIGRDLRVAWQRDLHTIAGAFSADGSRLAVLHGRMRDTVRLSLIDIDTGTPRWSKMMPLRVDNWMGSTPRVRFVGGIVFVSTHERRFTSYGRRDPQSRTVMARLDGSARSSVDFAIRNGPIIATYIQGRLALVQLSPNVESNRIAIREWEYDTKD